MVTVKTKMDIPELFSFRIVCQAVFHDCNTTLYHLLKEKLWDDLVRTENRVLVVKMADGDVYTFSNQNFQNGVCDDCQSNFVADSEIVVAFAIYEVR